MKPYRVQVSAGRRIDEIYLYTREAWGEPQAQAYIRGLFQHFEAITAECIAWRPIPAEFGIDGYVSRYEKHFVYWKVLSDGAVGVVTILHERMHQIASFQEDLER